MDGCERICVGKDIKCDGHRSLIVVSGGLDFYFITWQVFAFCSVVVGLLVVAIQLSAAKQPILGWLRDQHLLSAEL